MTLELPFTNPVLVMAVSITAFLLAPFVSRWLQLPSLVVVIGLGALIGPNGLGLLARGETMVLLGTVGLLYLMFVAGLELDLRGFVRHRIGSLAFGLLSFVLPLLLALLAAPLLGFGWEATLLIGAIVASHTLLAYPIVARLGLARSPGVTATVGGTLLTDTLALALLAVVGALAAGGADTPVVWLRLLLGLGAYVLAVSVVLPRVGRAFFRNTDAEAAVRYVFLLAAMFVSAALAELAGAQPIIGAFLAGLALNRLTPERSTVMARVRFVGDAVFIPFFLLSVGMLVDLRVLLSLEVALLAAALIAMVVLGKGGAALLAQRLLRLDRREGVVMAGLSIPQAAATLAVTFVGLELGLFGPEVVNAVIGLILVSVALGAVLVERGGRALVLAQRAQPAPLARVHRMLIPLANPDTAERLLEVAFLLRDRASDEAVYPLVVVPDEAQVETKVAAAERVLAHAVVVAAEADVPVTALTRVATNPASGILAAARERRVTDVIIGWSGDSSARRAVFGGVIDQVIAHGDEQVLVCRLDHAIATSRRLFVVLPPGIDYGPGFFDAARTLSQLAAQLGVRMSGLAVRTDPQRLQRCFDAVGGPGIDIDPVGSWPALLERLRRDARAEDLVSVISARRGTVAWTPALERLPGMLAGLGTSFLAVYPSERALRMLPGDGDDDMVTVRSEHVMTDLRGDDVGTAIASLLACALEPGSPSFAAALRSLSSDDVEFAAELIPHTLIAHARLRGLRRRTVLLGLHHRGLEHPRSQRPIRRVVLLLSPREHDVARHLSALAQLAHALHHVGERLDAGDGDAEAVAAALRDAARRRTQLPEGRP